jgi:hypothetical protein
VNQAAFAAEDVKEVVLNETDAAIFILKRNQ